MGVEWEFPRDFNRRLNGRLMGDSMYWMGHFTRFNEATKQTIYPWGEHEDMMEYHGSHEWYFQQHLRMSIFSGVFHCPRCSRYDQTRGPKISCLKGHAFIILQLLHPRMKNLEDIWILQPTSQPSLSILRVLWIIQKAVSRGLVDEKIEGLEGLEDPDFAGHRGGFHVYFQEGKLLTWKTTNSSPVCSEKPWFWKWLVFTNIKLGYIRLY